MKTICEQTKLIAHRGLSSKHCENTYPAFYAACNKDFYGVETDIQFTVDNKIVCFHDKTLKRLAGDSSKITSIRYRDLKKKDLSVRRNRFAKYKICPFTQYLKVCKKYGKCCIIEIKGQPSESQLDKLIRISKRKRKLENCIFISFNSKILRYIREKSTEANLQLLVSSPMKRYVDFCKRNNINASVIDKMITKDLILKLNGKGINVSVWLVNNKQSAQKFVNEGVEHITTNFFM